MFYPLVTFSKVHGEQDRLKTIKKKYRFMLFFKYLVFFEIKSVSEVACFELNEAVLFQKPTGAFSNTMR